MDRQAGFFQLMVYSPNGHNNQDWARSEPEFTLGLLEGHRDLSS